MCVDLLTSTSSQCTFRFKFNFTYLGTITSAFKLTSALEKYRLYHHGANDNKPLFYTSQSRY